MKENETTNNIVDVAIDAIKADKPSDTDMTAATERVHALIKSHAKAPASDLQFNSIEHYIAAIPDYLENRLTPAQALLFEEESRQSIPLRRALGYARDKARDKARNNTPRVSPQKALHRNARKAPPFRWLAAAAAIAVLAISVVLLLPGLPSLDQSRLVQVEEIDGRLYQITDGRLIELAPGTWIDGQQGMRTAKDSSAILLLDDGSRIEVNGRSELSVTRRASGNRIDVERGRIIVTASPQGSGTLDVATNEFIVSVTGTIFEVGHGAMGSRVAVIEGEVEVYQRGDSTSLMPGEQMGSRTGFSTWGASAWDTGDDISWSRDADLYIEMLREVSTLQRDVAAVMATEPRYSTRLLNLAPENTAVYIAVPNAPEKIAEVYQLLRSRLQHSQQLAAAWQDIESEGESQRLDDVMSWLREVGTDLGDETVVTLSLQSTDDGTDVVPVVLSEVNAETFTSTFESHIQQLHQTWADAEHQHHLQISLIEHPADAVSGQLSIWLHEDLLIASISAEALRDMQIVLEKESSAFVGTEFHRLLEDSYDDGAEFLAGAHLGKILSRADLTNPEMNVVGLDNAQYLIVERRREGDYASLAAELKFDGERTGIMSWLANPGPMGSLEFFSVNATIAAAFLVKDPSVIIDEMEQLTSRITENPTKQVESALETEAGFGLDLRKEIIATLGGEFALGLDGPALPTPAWKAIIEVYDVAGLQAGIERAIEHLNQRSTAHDEAHVVSISSADVDNYDGYQISVSAEADSQPTVTFNYAYVDGYLVAAANKALVTRAISQYRSGAGLLTDEGFRSMLPKDGQLDFSAVAFNRISELIDGLIERLPGKLSPDQQNAIKELSGKTGPSMFSVYAHPSDIRFVQKGNTDLPFSLSRLISLQSVIGGSPFSAFGDRQDDEQ